MELVRELGITQRIELVERAIDAETVAEFAITRPYMACVGVFGGHEFMKHIASEIPPPTFNKISDWLLAVYQLKDRKVYVGDTDDLIHKRIAAKFGLNTYNGDSPRLYCSSAVFGLRAVADSRLLILDQTSSLAARDISSTIQQGFITMNERHQYMIPDNGTPSGIKLENSSFT